ncbi:MAG TPA: hypothetical protein PLP42_06840 [Acidobacteriota bacterium]|mgnify:CR=1 FL=1|nr:hypothetical protein [Acidobacteriota bacterium]
MKYNGTQARPSLQECLHIYGLFSFALAQPLFDVLARNPEYFVAHQTKKLDLAILLLLVVVVIPGIALLALWLVGLVSQRLRRLALLAGICLLVAAIFNPPLKQLPDWLNGLRALAALTTGVGVA